MGKPLVIIRDIVEADYVTDDYHNYWNASGELVSSKVALASGLPLYKIADFNTVTHRFNRDIDKWERAIFIEQREESNE